MTHNKSLFYKALGIDLIVAALVGIGTLLFVAFSPWSSKAPHNMIFLWALLAIFIPIAIVSGIKLIQSTKGADKPEVVRPQTFSGKVIRGIFAILFAIATIKTYLVGFGLVISSIFFGLGFGVSVLMVLLQI